MASYIKLTNGEVAIVDDEFHEQLSKMTWAAFPGVNCIYARSAVYRKLGKWDYQVKNVLMHRLVLQLAGRQLTKRTDHINRNGLDNRLDNLRPCDASQNRCNTGPRKNNKCGYKGVSAKRNGTFAVMIQLHGKQKDIGRYFTAEDAARAYDAAARELHGEFAYQNFPAEQVA